MKSLTYLCGLLCLTALLAGCPDAKPPKDPTMIPTPKTAPTGLLPAQTRAG
jgi:hypothetical protein